MADDLVQGFALGEFSVLPREGQINGPGGGTHVEPKVMELLLALAARPREVVSRRELIDTVWGRAYGADESLTRCISALRRVLGDSTREPRFLETVSKRGYRLVAPVSPLAKRGGGQPAPGPRAAGPAAPSVAVLPFVNLSDDPENEFFADGLSIELITALSRIKGLRVAARISSFSFKGRSEDARAIGEQLSVGTVLDGTVRKAGDRLRITAQLIDTHNGYQMWSERYDRRMEDIFQIQDEIAGSIVDALSMTLEPTPPHARLAGVTGDVQAYEAYLRGWGFFRRFGPGNLNRAREMFQRAVEIEPGYAAAWAGMSISASFLYMYYDSSAPVREQADAASARALRLGPQLADAYTARGLAHMLSSRYEEAEAAFEESIRRDPLRFEPYYCYARACVQQGKMRKAAGLFQKAMEVEPADYQSPLLLVQVLLALGEKDKALAMAHRGVEVTARHLELYPDDPRALSMALGSLLLVGQPEVARARADRALAVDGENPSTLYNIACHFALTGDLERAMDCLEKSALRGSAIGDWIEQDLELAALRDHPRFKALLRQIRNDSGHGA